MTYNSVVKYQKDTCVICDNSNLQEVLSLPNFPLTGIYVDDYKTEKFMPVDQSLLFCPCCQHAQLLNHLDPIYLYHETYTHRSSLSPIAKRGNDFFVDYLETLIEGKKFKTVLEVGCNDLYMLEKLSSKGEHIFGLDPIWEGRESEAKTYENISVLGKFIEDLNPKNDLNNAPDLIVSTHTFEHINEPKEVMKQLVEMAAPGALIAIEVPSLDTLLELNRFDQVFHQHIHYYSLASFKYLINSLGCSYVSHKYNYSYWGGTMLIAFEKTDNSENYDNPETITREIIDGSISRFKAQLSSFNDLIKIQRSMSKIYGYGGAQMLPTIAYHLNSDLSWCEAILDDDESRNNKMYPHMPVKIIKPSNNFSLSDSAVFIGALDSARPILNRLLSLNPKRILHPLSIM